MERLIRYFSEGITSRTLNSIGAEVETQFMDNVGFAISTETSQKMLFLLTERRWRISGRKGGLITSLTDQDGNQINYELGRHNIEISTAPTTVEKIINVTRLCLSDLYWSASVFEAEPFFAPIFPDDEDLLIIPDERDAIWLELDGREALAPLAKTSSVQFTFSVASNEAITILNRFGARTGSFLADYPQDGIWKRYITESLAGYRSDRYGGPLVFGSLDDYCRQLSKHDVVQGTSLRPFSQVEELEIPLYLRSIWWHFRLKRYGNDLCIEVRPQPRRRDALFDYQLEKVLEVVAG